MKSAGLSAHFSSQDHKNALTDYYNFVHGNCQIDILFDKNAREASIET